MGKQKYEIALVGNPNCGKTSLFNNLSGSRQRVGNWPGVTIELKKGSFEYRKHKFELMDLPGTYSLSSYSIEEEVVERYFAGAKANAIINIVDATNLERHLFFTMQLIDLGLPIIVAVNMMDEAESLGLEIDFIKLAKMLGVPVVPITARTNKGTKRLLDTVVKYVDNHAKNEYKIEYSEAALYAINEIEQKMEACDSNLSKHARAINLLCGRKTVVADEQNEKLHKTVEKSKSILELAYNKDTEDIFESYWIEISKNIARTTVAKIRSKRFHITDKIDEILLHPLLGVIIFAACMWLTFQLVFVAGAPLMDLIDGGIGILADTISKLLPDGFLKSLIVEGIIGGVGGVLVFLPNILLLFLVIGFLEDSGYMSRAAFVMDRIMHKVGLHGKSFIPMLVGFGCTVPGIMSTRSLDTKRDRLITALVLPFMSCGARLPVYTLFISAFFVKQYQAPILFSLYFLGIIVAIFMANLLGFIFFGKEVTPFIMELPPYRLPTLKSVLLLMWMRGWMYIKKAGTLLLMASLIIWFLCAYPVMNSTQVKEFYGYDSSELVTLTPEQVKQANIENSYAGRVGKMVEPVMRPLGFDWKVSVALMTGIAAKEAVVSTLGVVYGVSSAAEDNTASLANKIKTDSIFKDNPWLAYGFMVFVLLNLPCIAVIVVFKKEFGLKWMLFLMGYTTAVAWLATFVVRGISMLFI